MEHLIPMNEQGQKKSSEICESKKNENEVNYKSKNK
jgi:hypothetical protein